MATEALPTPDNPYRVVIDDREPGERGVYMAYTPVFVQLAGSDTVWISGTTALGVYHDHPHDPKDLAALPEDAYTQAKMTIANLTRELESVGAKWTDVVAGVAYIADIQTNGPHVLRALGEELGGLFDHPQGMGTPGGTIIGVQQLIDPGNYLEMEIVAVMPPSRRVEAVRRAAAAIEA